MFCRVAVCFFAVFLIGCDSGPAVSKITGKVTLDGQAIGDATVTLSPVSGGTGKSAVGKTDANGVFTVTDSTSDKIGAGAVAGEYKVGILWFKPDPNDTSRSSGSSETTMNSDKATATKATGPQSLLPAAYQNPETSGLTLTVKSGSNPAADFALDSKFKGGKK